MPGAHPQNCDPRDLSPHFKPFGSCEAGLPATCPGSQPGRPCLLASPVPKVFAEFCVSKQISIEDAIAMSPAWLYSREGEKIGTRSSPGYRLSDYVIALELARHLKANKARIQFMKVGPVTKQGAAATREPGMKKPKDEAVNLVEGSSTDNGSESEVWRHSESKDELSVEIKS